MNIERSKSVLLDAARSTVHKGIPITRSVGCSHFPQVFMTYYPCLALDASVLDICSSNSPDDPFIGWRRSFEFHPHFYSTF